MKYVISVTCRNLASGYLEWTAQLLTRCQVTNLPQSVLQELRGQLSRYPGVVACTLSRDSLAGAMDLHPEGPAKQRLLHETLHLGILGINANGRMPFLVHFSQSRHIGRAHVCTPVTV